MTGVVPSSADAVVNLNPGPVPLSDATRRAMVGPMVSHRSPEFEALFRDCRERLTAVFQTRNDLIIVNGNGNVGLETAIASSIGPNDRVVCLTNGKFGDNLVAMLSRHAAAVHTVTADWGAAFELDEVEDAIEEDVAAVAMTHCETSTGMINPVKPVADLAADHGALSIIDGVSSIGGEPLPVDDWGIDLAITASQKCLSAPPGLSFVSISERAAVRCQQKQGPVPYNLDIERYLQAAERDQTPSTAPVHTYRALRRSLTEIFDRGLEEYMASQARRAEAIRRAGVAMGLEVFPAPNQVSRVSNTVTALELPAAVRASEVASFLKEQGVLVGTGIGPLAERIIRLATMSTAITDEDVIHAIRTLQSVLESVTDAATPDGISAAEAVLDTPATR